MRRIVFTGGGTAGHVTPNLALIPHFLKDGWDVHYIGTASGIERTLVEPLGGVTYHSIHSGKLRRYFDLKNFTDPFRVLQGAYEATSLLGRLRPNVVFSKGGFVSVPVVYGAWLHRIPSVLHESDMTPGLANRITIPLARQICTSFPETAAQLGAKAVHTGTPLRPSLFSGSAARGRARLGFDGERPLLTMMGGSTGAVSVNTALRGALPGLLERFQVAHICGKGNLDAALEGMAGYRQLEYVDADLPDVLAATDLMLCRAGANTLAEVLSLKKPMLLVPYPMGASRGDQIQNAASFARRGFARVLPQEEMTPESLAEALLALWDARATYLDAMENEPLLNGVDKVIETILAAATA